MLVVEQMLVRVWLVTRRKQQTFSQQDVQSNRRLMVIVFHRCVSSRGYGSWPIRHSSLGPTCSGFVVYCLLSTKLFCHGATTLCPVMHFGRKTCSLRALLIQPLGGGGEILMIVQSRDVNWHLNLWSSLHGKAENGLHLTSKMGSLEDGVKKVEKR